MTSYRDPQTGRFARPPQQTGTKKMTEQQDDNTTKPEGEGYVDTNAGADAKDGGIAAQSDAVDETSPEATSDGMADESEQEQ